MVKDGNSRVMITFSGADLDLLNRLSKQLNMSKSQIVHIAINGSLYFTASGQVCIDINDEFKK